MPESGQKTTQGHITERAPESIGNATARRTGLLVTLVLGGLTALPPLSMDMYLPALPEVTGALNAPAAIGTCRAGRPPASAGPPS
ncbi:hypothetical protein ACWCQ0_53400, partial [Streptomyces massasporeus]